tara:strand:- start:83 stop:589 length:507 start_codon:yes stop_codon:yes gene_type:complete
MRKILLSILTLTLFLSCEEKATIEFDDAKSTAILGIFDAYMANDMSGIADVYAEDAYVFSNSTDSISIKDNLVIVASHHEMFDNIECVWGDQGRSAWVETVTYPGFGKVSKAWFTWKGVGKASGQAVEVPTNISYFWGNEDKIQRSFLNNDTSAFLKEQEFIQSMTAQ